MFEGQAALEADLEQLAEERYCQSALEIARELRSLLLPPENISTRDCAARYRYLPNPEGTGKRLYDPALTPYTDAIHDALDDPRYQFVIVPGAARTGKSVPGENFLFKRFRHGPKTDVIIFLPSSSDIDSYADKEFGDLFSPELNPELAAQVGKRTTDNKRELKRLGRHVVQLLPANKGTVRQKQAPFIHASEIDGYTRIKPSAVKGLVAIRGRFFGNQFKAYLESHPDEGLLGIAGEWALSTRGLWYWPCAHCAEWSSPHPYARKGMHMRLDYERRKDMADDDMLDHVARTARLVCPHCGAACDDDDKIAMLAGGKWVFEGQTIAPDGTVVGEIKPNDTAGFWVHGTMSPFVKLGTLAKEYVGALVLFERTRKSERLREITAKSLGEVFQGGSGAGLQASRLIERAGDGEDAERGFAVGTVPSDAVFVTAAVDPGKRKFDIGIWGWDLEGRSWLIDRVTRTQRLWPDGQLRDLRPAERVEDWEVLEPLLDRIIPFADDPTMGLPIAAVAIDTGGTGFVSKDDSGEDVQSGSTWKAREFARRMARKGKAWKAWQKVRLIKGAKSRTADEIPVMPRKISKDENGQPVLPVIDEWDLGVHKLRLQALDWLRTEDDTPGQCYFATGLPSSTFDEFVGERWIDGEWVRTGPNESLDLFGYANAVRLMLKPDRAEIKWDVRRPVWATPVPVNGEGGDPAVAGDGAARASTPKKSIFERFDELNSEDE